MHLLIFLVALFVTIVLFYLGYCIVSPIYEEEYVGGWVCGVISFTIVIGMITLFLSMGG